MIFDSNKLRREKFITVLNSKFFLSFFHTLF
jgi:hypothetical protein